MSSESKKRPIWRRWLIRAGKNFLRWNGEFQTRHSLIPTTPTLDNKVFDWVPELEAAYPDIRKELDHLLQHPEDIPAFHQLSPDQKRISKGDNWKTFGFYVYGQRVDANCAVCPRTAAVLDKLPGMRTAMFSILKPHYHIEPHRGPTRAVVRAHMGLKVPEQKDKVWLRVDNDYIHWDEGKVVLFDDFYEHEVRNDTDEYRAVLFLDIDRPMDKVGTLVNRLLFALISASPYVKQPLKNLAAWNKNQQNQK